MLKFRVFVAMLVVSMVSVTGWCQNSAIQRQTRAFLDAYASGDKAAILSMIDAKNITAYGSDTAEIAHGADAFMRMLAQDQQLWHGSAHLGGIEHVSIVRGRALAAIFFDAPFSVAGRPPVDVRFAAVWKREGGRWLLIQSSNTVPTEHQSAAELLHQMEH